MRVEFWIDRPFGDKYRVCKATKYQSGYPAYKEVLKTFDNLKEAGFYFNRVNNEAIAFPESGLRIGGIK